MRSPARVGWVAIDVPGHGEQLICTLEINPDAAGTPIVWAHGAASPLAMRILIRSQTSAGVRAGCSPSTGSARATAAGPIFDQWTPRWTLTADAYTELALRFFVDRSRRGGRRSTSSAWTSSRTRRRPRRGALCAAAPAPRPQPRAQLGGRPRQPPGGCPPTRRSTARASEADMGQRVAPLWDGEDLRPAPRDGPRALVRSPRRGWASPTPTRRAFSSPTSGAT